MPLEINVPADGSVMVEVWCTLIAQQTRTRFFFERGAGAEVCELDALVGAVTQVPGAVATTFALLSVDLDPINVRGYGFNSAGLAIGWKDYTASDITPLGGSCELPQAAWCVKKRTGLPGRSQRGRWYFPGLPTEVIQDGQIAEASRASYSTPAVALGNPIDEDPPVGNLLPAICTLNTLGNIQTSKLIGETVPTWIVRDQRRRQIGVGI